MLKLTTRLAIVASACLVASSRPADAQTAIGYYARYREANASTDVPCPTTNSWQNVFVDSTTHTMYRKDSSCSVTAIGSGGGGGAYYQTMQDEGSAIAQESTFNFTGDLVTCSDDSVHSRSVCNIVLPASGVTAGSCTNCSITVDSHGIVTAQSSGAAVSLPAGQVGYGNSGGTGITSSADLEYDPTTGLVLSGTAASSSVSGDSTYGLRIYDSTSQNAHLYLRDGGNVSELVGAGVTHLSGSPLDANAVVFNDGRVQLQSRSTPTAVGEIGWNGTNFVGSTTGSTWDVTLGSGGASVSITCGAGLTCSPSTITGTGSVSLAATAVTAGSYGDATHVPNYTVNAEGQLTAAASTAITGLAESAVTNLTSDLAARVLTTTTVTGTSGLTGGGALSSNQTLSLSWPITDGTSSNTYTSNVADSSSAVAHIFNTGNAFSTTGDKIASFRSNGSEVAYVAGSGQVWSALSTSAIAFGGTNEGFGWTAGTVYEYASGGAVWQYNSSGIRPEGDLAITNGDSTHRWTEVDSRHFAGSQTTAPTASSLGTGISSVTVTGSDASALITLTVASPSAGELLQLNWNASYAIKPNGISIKPVNLAAANMDNACGVFADYDAAGTTTGGLVISCRTLSSSTTYTGAKFSATVIQ